MSARDERLEKHSEPPDRSLIIPTKNLLLAALPHQEANKLVSACHPTHFEAGDEIYIGGDEINYLYFPIDCVASSLALLEDGTTVEVSMTGREGIVGMAAVVGGGRALHWTRVSVSGNALRIPNVSIQEQFAKSESVQKAVLSAYRHLFTQVCQRSVCNTRHTLVQRLSVWLLMMQDRIDSEKLPFTQEDIAGRISVRRAGISVAAAMLSAMHAISYHRGKIVITDRDVLEKSACECYRILGWEFHAEEWGEDWDSNFRMRLV